MKKKVLLLTLTMLLVFGVVQVASAGVWGWGGGSGPRVFSADNWTSLADTLGLTDEQAAKMQELQQNMYNQTQSLRDQLREKMFALRQLTWQKNVDMATVEARMQEVNDLRSQLYNQKQAAWQQMRSVLTQDQLAKIGTMQGFGPRRGMGGQWGGPAFSGSPTPRQGSN
ncbi:MAG: Spy/CpxP family protein refolding chaperone [Desulfotomaculales bacterium]